MSPYCCVVHLLLCVPTKLCCRFLVQLYNAGQITQYDMCINEKCVSHLTSSCSPWHISCHGSWGSSAHSTRVYIFAIRQYLLPRIATMHRILMEMQPYANLSTTFSDFTTFCRNSSLCWAGWGTLVVLYYGSRIAALCFSLMVSFLYQSERCKSDIFQYFLQWNCWGHNEYRMCALAMNSCIPDRCIWDVLCSTTTALMKHFVEA